MKKILSVLLLAAMMVGCIMPTLVSAAGDHLTVAVKGPAEIAVWDESVDLDIQLAGNDDSGIWGMTLVVAYTSGWSVDSIANGTLWDDGEFGANAAPAPSAYAKALADFGLDADGYDFAIIDLQKANANDALVTEDGVVASIKLNAPAALNEGDTLDVKIIYDKNGPMTVVDGKPADVALTVGDYSATVCIPEGVPAAFVTNALVSDGILTVEVEAANLPAVTAMGIEGITYDKSVLTFVGGVWAVEDSLFDDFKVEDETAALMFTEATEVNGTVCVLIFAVNPEVTEEVTTAVKVDFTARAVNAEGVEEAVEVKSVAGSVTITTVMYGDVNGDEIVDSDDALYLLECFMNGLEEDEYNQNVDFNYDGVVDSDDALTLLEMFMNGEFDND